MAWEWDYIFLSNITTGFSRHGFQQTGIGNGKHSIWVLSTSSNFCLSFPHLQYMVWEKKICFLEEYIYIYKKKGLKVPAFQ